jgi:hypothetical protein
MPRRPNEGLRDVEGYQGIAQFDRSFRLRRHRGRNDPARWVRRSRRETRRDLTCGRRARKAKAVPCDHSVHTSAEPIQRLDAPEAPEDPPHASECPSGLGERAVSAVWAVVRVDPPHGLGDRMAREPYRGRVIDELPRHHPDPGWKTSPGEVRGPGADPAVPIEDQGGLSVVRVRRRLLHNTMVSIRTRRST